MAGPAGDPRTRTAAARAANAARPALAMTRGAGDDDGIDDDDGGLDDDDEDLAAALGTTARAATRADRGAEDACGIREAGRLVN